MNAALPTVAEGVPQLATLSPSAKPMLSLRPQLANHCYFVAHGKKASVLWSEDNFDTLSYRMLNGNGEHAFLLCYRDAQGKARFSKAFKQKVSKHVRWAFDTICGTQKVKTSIGFYPTNGDGESCWAALDFDAHDQHGRQRAYALAGKAFDLLSANPDLWLIAGTSGESGGWHVFIFTAHFYPIVEWARLLREVADKLGVPIQKGLLEIFPDGRTKGIGYAIRAPGSWNPKDDSLGLIAVDTATEKLRLVSPSSKGGLRLSMLGKAPREQKAALPSREFSTRWVKTFAIGAPRARHDMLLRLAGTIFLHTSKVVAEQIVTSQHAEADPTPGTPLEGHLAEFEAMWTDFHRDWLAQLSGSERQTGEPSPCHDSTPNE